MPFPFVVSLSNHERSNSDGSRFDKLGQTDRRMAFYLYILQCVDDSLYIGHTDNIDERMRQHDAGKADSYTATRRPLQLLHVEEFETRYEALTMERKLKGWSRAKKLAYIAGDWDAIGQLARNHQDNGGARD